MPRVMNVDKDPAFPAAVEALRAEGAIPQRVALRRCKYLNNVIEQDHRTVKKRVWLAKGYGSFQRAWRTLQGIETVQMIRKGRVRSLAKGDVVGQALFIGELFGLAAWPEITIDDSCWFDWLHRETSQRNRYACICNGRNLESISDRKRRSYLLADHLCVTFGAWNGHILISPRQSQADSTRHSDHHAL
jgi:DDE domain